MAAVHAMGKDQTKKKEQSDQLDRGTRRSFWHGLMEGFSGPLMMGTPLRGSLKLWELIRHNLELTITVGDSLNKHASLAVSSKEVGKALQHATDELMQRQRLVYRGLTGKKVGWDGKFHDVPKLTIDRAEDEQREQLRVDESITPRRG